MMNMYSRPRVLLADQVANGARAVAEGQHRGRARMDAELVLDRHTVHVVALAQRAIVIDQQLGHEEQGDALHALGGSRGARKHQMDDVVGEIMLAEADEDLLAVDAWSPSGMALALSSPRSEPACGSVRFIEPVHSPDTIL
jgi:hypothetical protein